MTERRLTSSTIYARNQPLRSWLTCTVTSNPPRTLPPSWPHSPSQRIVRLLRMRVLRPSPRQLVLVLPQQLLSQLQPPASGFVRAMSAATTLDPHLLCLFCGSLGVLSLALCCLCLCFGNFRCSFGGFSLHDQRVSSDAVGLPYCSISFHT